MSAEEPHFLVNPYNDPVVVKILGKASFMNSAPLKSLFDRLAGQDRRRFVIDFQKCTGMDSTFLGILAGLGIAMMKLDPPGKVVLCRLSKRNAELIQNLGLHQLLVVDDGFDLAEVQDDAGLEGLIADPANRTEIENARLVLEAHENLVAVDASNQTKFQDVIAFLRNQLDEG